MTVICVQRRKLTSAIEKGSCTQVPDKQVDFTLENDTIVVEDMANATSRYEDGRYGLAALPKFEFTT